MALKIEELFYSLELKSKEFEDGVARSEGAFRRFVNYVKANPLPVLGAVASAFLFVGLKAAEAAERMEAAYRKVGQRAALTAGEIKRLRQEGERLAVDFGIPQERIAALFAKSAEAGNKSAGAIESFTRATLRLNAALGGTPDDLEQTASGLDQVMDLFHGSADQADDFAARLFAAARGTVAVGEVLDGLKTAAPVIQELGLSFDQALGAIVRLLESGLSPRQLPGRLKEVAEQSGQNSKEFRDLTAALTDTTTAAAEFNTEVAKTITSTETLRAGIRARLSNAFLDFGDRVLPIVANALENIAALMDDISGKGLAAQAPGILGDLVTAAKNRDPSRFVAGRGDRRAFRRFEAVQASDAITALNAHPEQLLGLSAENLELLRKDLDAVTDAVSHLGDRSIQEVNKLRGNIAQAQAQNAERRSTAGATSDTGTNRADQVGRGPAIPRGPSIAADAVRQAVEEAGKALDPILADLQARADKAAAEQLAAVTVGTGLTEEQVDLLERAVQFDSTRAEALRILDDEAKRLSDELAVQNLHLDGSNDSLTKRVANEERLRRVTAARNKIERQGVEDGKEALKNANDLARKIESAVTGALQLAAAFGLISEETSQALSNIARLASSIGPLSAAIKGFKAGDLGFGEVVGAALPVLGAVASLGKSLFGGQSAADQAAEAERARKLEENTRAIEKLSEVFGEFGLDVKGATFAAAAKLAGNFGGNTSVSGQFLRQAGVLDTTQINAQKFDAFLKTQGTSRRDLQDLADTLGLDVDFFSNNINEVIDAFSQLNAAIQKTELTKFAETFEGQMQALEARFELFDITDPIAQLEELKKVIDDLGTGSPALSQALAGLDLNTAEGRAAAEANLQGLFEQLNAGTLKPEQLGNLTPEQFLDELKKLEALIDAANSQTGTTQGFNVDRTITEVTGSRIAGILVSQDIRLAEISANSAGILAILRAAAGLDSLAIAADGSVSAGGVNIENLTIEVAAGPGDTGDRVADSFLDRLSQKIAGRVSVGRRQYGDASVGT